METVAERRRQEAALVEAVYGRFEGAVCHPTTRWYSRNPDTGEWENDRMWGRRLQILDDLFDERRETEMRSWRCFQALEDRPGQYAFLSKHSRRWRELSVPEVRLY